MKREIKDQPGSGTMEQGSHDACKLSADAGFNCTVADLLTSQVSLPFAWITGQAIDPCFGLPYPYLEQQYLLQLFH